ncbi:MAG: SPOR domain-containing protein [Marinobacter sp.]|nr:SPOR domain-containing protein [Marinobacter sp.]
MKWAVFCLVLVNVVFGLWVGSLTDHSWPSEAAHGRLPRVAPIEIVGSGVPDPAPGGEAATTSDQQSPPEVSAGRDQGAEKSAGSCLIVGWFDSSDAARAAAKAASGIPDSAIVRSETRPATPYHWVILPPAASREAALKRLADIQQRGIDSYLITEGVHANGISLGLFESLEAAEAVLSRSQSQGLEATLATFPRNHIRYALVFSAQSSDLGGPLSQTRKELEKRFGSVTFGRCEGVATTQKNP